MADIIEVRYEDAGITRLFQQITARGRNPRPLLAAWGERLKNSVRKNIMEGGRPAKFTPLKPVTARAWLFSKKSYWTKSGGLTAAGQARAGNRTPLFTGNPGGLLASINWREVPAGLAVGSDKVYAAIHNFGGTIQVPDIWPKVKAALMWPGALHPVKMVKGHAVTIPARPYLVIQDDDWAYMRQSALQYLLGEGAWK
jgi:phage gpG-like protein